MNCKKIISVCLTISLLAGCSGKKSNPVTNETAISVLTTKASRIRSGTEISLSGNIEGSKTVRLGFLVAGKIDFIAVGEITGVGMPLFVDFNPPSGAGG